MESDREKIFASIRRGLRGIDKLIAPRSASSPLRKHPATDFQSMFERFGSELSVLGGEAVTVKTEGDAADFVSAHTTQDSSIFIYDDVRMERKSLTSAIADARRSKFGSEFAAGYDKRDVAGFDCAITGCLACIAETGTVVIGTDMRLPAALAEKLFVIVNDAQLLPSLDQLFTDKFGDFRGSNLFLITGPSRTADIEKQLVKGVHGPREVHVIFVQG